MANSVQIIVKDSEGNITKETTILTPNLAEAEEVHEEIGAFISTSTIVQAYEHIGNRPNDRG